MVSTSSPSSRIWPSVRGPAGRRRSSAMATVDLPQPDSPATPTVSPSWTSRLTPRTAGTSPWRRLVRDVQVADGQHRRRRRGPNRLGHRLSAPPLGPIRSRCSLIDCPLRRSGRFARGARSSTVRSAARADSLAVLAHRDPGWSTRRGSRIRSSARPTRVKAITTRHDAQARGPVVPPGAERDRAAGQRALEHLPPRRLEGVAEAEEGQRRLGQDGARHGQDGVGQDQRRRCGAGRGG